MDQTGSQSAASTGLPGAESGARSENVYAMSHEGRRQALLLLVGVVSIWIFALWSLVTILQDGVSGVEFVSGLLMLGLLVVAPAVAWTLLEEANARIVTSERGIEYRTLGGVNLPYAWGDIAGFKAREGRGRIARFFLGDEEIVDINSNGHIVEASGSRPGEMGNGKTDGVEDMPAATDGGAQTLAAPTAQSDGAGDGYVDGGEDDDEPETLLLKVRNDRSSQIANPLTRFLHRQAHGVDLPIYGGLENRSALLSEIAGHVGPSSSTVVSPNRAEDV